ncbi:BRO-N domain-containing protein [Pseudomonas caspiana]
MRITNRHKKTPTLAGDGVLSNESNYQERNVMANISTTASNVIPFSFGRQQVRTLMIDDQPWFAAQDVLDALEYADTYKPSRAVSHVPAQWKGVQRLHTLGGTQQIMMISEQGLYFVLGRSDKPKALPFQMWLAGEVLPTIRKTGGYTDHQGSMGDLVGSVIGSSGEVVLDRVIDQKAYSVPRVMQRSFRHTMKSRLRSRFNVQRTALIPAECLADACNFVAAYALEGEFIAREIGQSKVERLNINFPLAELVKHRPEMLTIRNSEQAWLDVNMQDLCSRPQDLSLCEKALCELRDNGYDIEGAWFEVRSLRNRLGELNSFLIGLGVAMQHPTRYAVDLGDAA